MRNVLASGSPQRKAILEQLGIEFEVVVADVPELEAGEPIEVVRVNARRKAQAVAQRIGTDGRLILGVDTEVYLDGEVFGKPADAAQARAMLGRLNGRTHEVISGFALIRDGAEELHHDTTRVTFRTLTDAQIDAYVALGEWEEIGRAHV